MIRLAITDDHEVVRQGLKQLLNSLGNFEIVAEFSNGDELIASFEELKSKTDIFILDYSMPKMSGLQLMEELSKNIGDEKFLILTQNDQTELKIAFYKLGVRGFISKTCSGDELKTALEQIHTSGFYNLQESMKLRRKQAPDLDPLAIISLKEKEFIGWVCCEEEFTYEQIAEKMNLSVKTIDYYRNNLFEKFGIKSKVGLILFSHKHKLTKPFV